MPTPVSPVRIVGLQLGVTVVLATVAALVGRWPAASSVLLGGASCLIPNVLFVARLASARRRPGGANPGSFLAGELLKVASTAALMFGVGWFVRDLSWPWFMAGVIAALKSYFAVPLLALRRPPR